MKLFNTERLEDFPHIFLLLISHVLLLLSYSVISVMSTFYNFFVSLFDGSKKMPLAGQGNTSLSQTFGEQSQVDFCEFKAEKCYTLMSW